MIDLPTRSPRAPRAVLRRTALAVLAVCLAAAVHTVRAQQDQDQLTTKFPIDDADPERSVPTPAEALRMPLQMGYHIMLLSERADAAEKRGDLAAAIRYWRALAKASPDRSLPYQKLCKLHQSAGEYAKALDNCRTALGKQGTTLEDSERFVQLLLGKPGELTPSDVEEIDAVRGHVQRQLPKDSGALISNRMSCQLATRLSDVARMQACTAKLRTLAPSDPQTLVFAWSLALMQKDYAKAEAALARAKAAKLAPAALADMARALRVQRDRHASLRQRLLRTVPLLVVAIGVLGLGVASALRLRSRRVQ